MAIKKWIKSLFLGTWHLPSGDKFHCTPKTRDYFYQRSKEFLNSGLPLPICLEHQPTVGLSFHDRLAEQTKHTIGHCHDVRIGPQGELEFLADGDQEAFDILRRNKFVSPEIRQNVIDSRSGKRFAGPSIVHIAVTPRPVQVTGAPHVQLSTARAVNLEEITVDVSLSTAQFRPIQLSSGTSMAGSDCKKAAQMAHESSTAAWKASGTAHTSGKASDHAAAAAAHTTASTHHDASANSHAAAGYTEAAAMHENLSDLHKTHAEAHQKKSGVSMSGAPKQDDKPGADDGAASAMPPAAEPPKDGEPGEDLEGGGAITEPEAEKPGKDGDAAAAMAELEHELAELGIEFHASASDDMLTFLQHLNTALKTHKSTKTGGPSEPANPDENPGQSDQNQQQSPPENEVSESAPIMMSTTQLTPREQKMADKLLKNAKPAILSRINVLHSRGFIDDAIKRELDAEVNTVKLSASDLNADFDLNPLPITFKLDMLERQMKQGKPGPFAKVAAPAVKPNPAKPISSAVQLSTAEEETISPPIGDEQNQDVPVDPAIVNRLSGGQYDQYLAKKNGTKVA